MAPPRLGIGVPVYNGEQFLERALESLLAQTYTDYEIVVCDNASTDATQEIGRRFADADPRVRYHRNETNLGAAPNFNRTFELTSGELFKWAACDDEHEPTYLERCIEALDADPDVVLAHAAGTYIDADGVRVPGYDPDPIPHVADPRPHVRFEDLVMQDHWCMEVFGVMRRAVLAKTPLIASYVGSDRPLLAELGLYGKFHVVDEVLFLSREHPGRSVRTDKRTRGEWFDAKLRGRFSMMYWRCLWEYGRAVERVPLDPREKAACLRVLAPWMLNHRWQLRDDIQAWAKQVGSRLRPS